MEISKCVFCNQKEGSLVPFNFGKETYLVHPDHALPTDLFLNKDQKFKVPLKLGILSAGLASLYLPANYLYVCILFMGVALFSFPFSSKSTFNLLGIRNSIFAVRFLAFIAISFGLSLAFKSFS